MVTIIIRLTYTPSSSPTERHHLHVSHTLSSNNSVSRSNIYRLFACARSHNQNHACRKARKISKVTGEDILWQMQTLMGAISSNNQQSFMVELNISTQGMTFHDTNDKTTIINQSQTPPKTHNLPLSTAGLFAAMNTSIALTHKHLLLLADSTAGNFHTRRNLTIISYDSICQMIILD